ncbi:SIR2 family protein [Pantoea sp. SIMBA_079]|uniref:SIR2 family protein n=1 Tax=Pantoea sp. SIMBA_079 TaxID=3085817 RepID=UPI0039929D0C
MDKEFPCRASNIYDKNINFLFGSGASATYIPTLWLDKDTTYETLLSHSDIKGKTDVENYILSAYYNNIIHKTFCIEPKPTPKKFSKTLQDYNRFLYELVSLLERKGSNQIKRGNIFTTNYDLFFETAADIALNKKSFYFNDGALGFRERSLNISNFHLSHWHQGTHDLYKQEIPTVNIIKMHGSVSWNKNNEQKINIDYPKFAPEKTKLECSIDINDFTKNFNDTDEDLSDYLDLSKKDIDSLADFRVDYDRLAIVSPTKEKFSETVFQQHYYQSLRLLSYELEKPQTVLICFGFSFQDEHILEIIKRSLSNPTLKVFIFCYSKDSRRSINETINDSRITYIYPKIDAHNISFDTFIDRIFTSDNGDWISWTD